MKLSGKLPRLSITNARRGIGEYGGHGGGNNIMTSTRPRELTPTPEPEPPIDFDPDFDPDNVVIRGSPVSSDDEDE